MTNPYSPPTTTSEDAPQSERTAKRSEPSWPLYVFALFAIGVLTTGGVWVWFALERIYNTARPAAEMTAFSACFATGAISLILAGVLHRKSILFSGSAIRRIVQVALVGIATLPCALAVWAIAEEVYEILT